MIRRSVGIGALIGLLLTAALMAVMYVGYQALGLPFVPYDLFNWVARELPGNLITFGIDLMIDTMLRLGISVVDTAKVAERAMATVQFLVAGALAGAVYFAIMRQREAKGSYFSGLVMSAVFGLPLVVISLTIPSISAASPYLAALWLAVLFAAWGVGLGLAYSRLMSQAADEPIPAGAAADGVASVAIVDRRRFLIRFGAATAVVTVTGAALGSMLAAADRRQREATLADTMAHRSEGGVGQPFPNANSPVVPVPGTRPEYTPLKDHYKVFLQADPTVIDGGSWRLPITGLVDRPLMLTTDDLRNKYEPRHQYVTLTCISGRVGTGLIGTTRWTGASVQEVLADAGLKDAARYLIIACGDGFYETVDLNLIAADDRIMFCYDWDGHPLPADHGFPLRIWIPDRYGMKQPKWITAIEVTDTYRDGYWVERGWDKVAQVKATSVIDTVAVDDILDRNGQQVVPVGGIAYAGARGISKVQVRVDGGPWEDAQLREPLSDTTWVIWRYEWPFAAGDHRFEVRCAEADGTPQIAESTEARPDGSSGIHSREASL